jgi:hypothetical protein
VPDPESPARRLRFIGAPLDQRERILRRMVDHYFSGDDPLAMVDFDVHPVVGHRRCRARALP